MNAMPEEMLKEIEQADGQDTIYLSGPIRKATDNGKEWRESLIEDYSDDFDFINPLDEYSPETHEILSDPIDFDPDSDKEQVLPQEYIFTDKMNIQESDYVFVGLPEVISRGTDMEIMYAYDNSIPVFVWTMNGQKDSGWVRYHAEFTNSDRETVMEEIRNYE